MRFLLSIEARSQINCGKCNQIDWFALQFNYDTISRDLQNFAGPYFGY